LDGQVLNLKFRCLLLSDAEWLRARMKARKQTLSNSKGIPFFGRLRNLEFTIKNITEANLENIPTSAKMYLLGVSARV